MGKGLMAFTEGKDVFGARITKVYLTASALELGYEYRMENIGYMGTFKATSSDGERWSGAWTDRDQKWKSTTGPAELTFVHDRSRGLFYGTWSSSDGKAQGDWTLDIELPHGFK